MTEAANDFTSAELVAATAAHLPILTNLLQLYAHDFSEFHAIEIDPDGRFDYHQLPLYFSDRNRHPFLVMLDARPAGFVFVSQGSEVTGSRQAWDMAEFFILRAHRRRGLGTRMAHQVFARFPGPWEVRVMHSNRSARDFWARAISSFTSQPAHPATFQRGEHSWHLFRFDSRAA
jgi:predicted acetyltransferase